MTEAGIKGPKDRVIMGSRARFNRNVLVVSAFAVLVIALAARILGPSDLWDQTQPKTVSYTTDMIVHGRWMLPIERGEFPATKPPLYNWLAAPVVKVVGFTSEWAHKSPSIIALVAVWTAIIWLGMRIDRPRIEGRDSSLLRKQESRGSKDVDGAELDSRLRGLRMIDPLSLWERVRAFRCVRADDACVTTADPHPGPLPEGEGDGSERGKDEASRGNVALPGLVGWMAGLAIPTNYMLFKLGYLARPDMVLTLWLTLGWMAATAVIIAAEPRRFMQLAFWVCVGLAGLAKGPAALVLIVYGVFAGKALTGSWKNTARLGWLWGLPLALAMVGAWIVAVWRIDPEHLANELWYGEIAGRVTGTGPKGAEGSGPWYFLTSLPHMPYYFFSRVAPWSVVAILAIVHLWRRNLVPGQRNWQVITDGDGRWYHACALLIIITVVLFSLSTGKRADYVAATAPPAALLAAYWLLRVRPDVARWSPVLAPVGAAVVLGAMITVEFLQPFAPSRDYGREITTFIEGADEAIDAHPLPVVFYHAGESHLQAFLGKSEIDGLASFEGQVAQGEAFWLIEGPLPLDAPRVKQVLEQSSSAWTQTARVVSDPEAIDATWPGKITLWLVEPAD